MKYRCKLLSHLSLFFCLPPLILPSSGTRCCLKKLIHQSQTSSPSYSVCFSYPPLCSPLSLLFCSLRRSLLSKSNSQHRYDVSAGQRKNGHVLAADLFLGHPTCLLSFHLSSSPSALSLSRRGIPAGERKDVQRVQHHPDPSRKERQWGGTELRGIPPSPGWPEEDSALPPGCIL